MFFWRCFDVFFTFFFRFFNVFLTFVPRFFCVFLGFSFFYVFFNVWNMFLRPKKWPAGGRFQTLAVKSEQTRQPEPTFSERFLMFSERFFWRLAYSGSKKQPNANCVYLAFGFSGFFILKTFCDVFKTFVVSFSDFFEIYVCRAFFWRVSWIWPRTTKRKLNVQSVRRDN